MINRHFQRKPAQCVNAKVLSEPVLERLLVKELEKTVQQVDIEIKKKKPRDNSAQIAAVTRKIERLKELYLNELITLDEYKQDKDALTDKLESLRAQNTTELAPIRALKGVNITEVYKSLTPQEKRRFWRSIVSMVNFNAERGLRIEYR